MVTNYRAVVIEALVQIQQAGLQIRPKLETSLLVQRVLDDLQYWHGERNPTLGILGSLMFELSEREKHSDKPWTQGDYGSSIFVNAAFLDMPLHLKWASRADRKTACLGQLQKLAAMTEGELTIQKPEQKLRWFSDLKTTYSVGSTTAGLTICLGAKISLLTAIFKMNGDLKRHSKGQYVTFPELMDTGGLHIAYVTPKNFAVTEELFGQVLVIDNVLPWPTYYEHH
jgi:hypothetical protein